MHINYLAVLVCAVLSMVVGYIWYGPLFGKQWFEVMGADKMSQKQKDDMMSSSKYLYGIQFLMTLFQVWVLSVYIWGFTAASGLGNALWIWAGFIVPMIIGSAMWNGQSRRLVIQRVLLQSGYQFVIFAMFGVILQSWK